MRQTKTEKKKIRNEETDSERQKQRLREGGLTSNHRAFIDHPLQLSE